MDDVPRPGRSVVFAPSPLLTVTIEEHRGEPDIHLHPGGQGFWVARLMVELGAEVLLCGSFGGETGRVVQVVIEDLGIPVRAVVGSAWNGAYVHDRRSGERVTVADMPPSPLSRHDVDELFGAVLVEGLDADVCVLGGPGPWGDIVPPDTYRRLAADLRSNGRSVVADLSGEPLDAALAGGLAVAKVSHEELMRDGRVPGDGVDELAGAMVALAGAGAEVVVVTRAERSTLALVEGQILEVQPIPVEVVDSRGAGDSLTAGVAAGLARGEEILDALRLGTAAGSLNVTRRGLASGGREEIERLAGRVMIDELRR